MFLYTYNQWKQVLKNKIQVWNNMTAYYPTDEEIHKSMIGDKMYICKKYKCIK